MKTKKAIIVVIIFSIITFALFMIGKNVRLPIDKIGHTKIAGQTIKIELAVTEESQLKGLSGRDGILGNEGMLFVFTEPDEYGFWMKEMSFALDMIWIGEDLKIVYIKKDARPESYPEVFYPPKPAKYVLEVNSNFSDKYGLSEGDRVELLP